MLKAQRPRELTFALFVVALALLAFTASAQVIFPTVGIYDENTIQTNTVDFVAPGSTLDFNQFKTDIITAFNNDMGGVYQCAAVSSSSPYVFSYGVSQNKLLTITGPGNNMGVSWGGGTDIQSISEYGLWGNNGRVTTFNFPARASGEAVVKFGLTIPSFSLASRNVIATATFSDGSKSTASRVINELGGLGDTFFGFAAPSGQAIVSVTFTNSSQSIMPIDDFAFITAKFPSLNIAKIGGSQFRISWPTNATGFLECATNFTAPQWTPVTNTPVIMGDRFAVTLDSTFEQKFFKLRGQ